MLRTKLLALGGAATVALTLIASASLTSAATPAEVIAQRKALMDLQGATAIGIVTAMKAGDMAAVAKLAGPLGRSSAVIPSLFEKGTGPEAGKTAALPAIWEKWDDFKAAAAKLATESAKLAEVAKGGDAAATSTQFGALAKSCDGCHDAFRAKAN
jgi:cytochrome c556